MIGISRMANRAKYILLNLVSSRIICLFLNLSLEGETHGDWGCHVKTLPKALRTQVLTALTSSFGFTSSFGLIWWVGFGMFGSVGLLGEVLFGLVGLV